MNIIDIYRLPALDNLQLCDVNEAMEPCCTKHVIGNVNWPAAFPYQPTCTFVMAYTAKAIYVHFFSHGLDLRATNALNQSAVAQDSCVEFFVQLPGNPEYWNFEFNCIGAVNASHRVQRDNPVRLNDSQIQSIKRWASCGNEPFEERDGLHSWELTVAIPFELLGMDVECDRILGNLYKCGSKTRHPHYLSWSPIKTETPDFHCPRYFGRINLR